MLNDVTIEVPRISSEYKMLFVVKVCSLLQQTCLAKLNSPVSLQTEDIGVFSSNYHELELISDLDEMEVEVLDMFSGADTLLKLCIMRIRELLVSKTDEVFDQLCLAPGLLRLVKLHHIAEELHVDRLEDVEDLSVEFSSLFET